MKSIRMLTRWAGILALWTVSIAGMTIISLARADDRPDHHDHDRALAALKAGEVRPLQQVLDKVLRSYPGEVLEVELEREGGRWVYELKLLQADGGLIRLDVDAKTIEVLRSRQRPRNGGKQAASAPLLSVHPANH